MILKLTGANGPVEYYEANNITVLCDSQLMQITIEGRLEPLIINETCVAYIMENGKTIDSHRLLVKE